MYECVHSMNGTDKQTRPKKKANMQNIATQKSIKSNINEVKKNTNIAVKRTSPIKPL